MDATIATFIRYFRVPHELREASATMGPETGFQTTCPSSLPHVVDLTAILNWDGFPGFSLCYGAVVAKDDQKRKPQNDERRNQRFRDV
jgi:hypothetical protein